MKITLGRLAAAAAAGAVLPGMVVPATVAATKAARGAGAAEAVARSHAGVSPHRESGTLNCSQLEALWEQEGGSPSAAFTAAQVAMAESGGRQYATDKDSNGTTDLGYWQVNNGAWGSLATYNPAGNAKAAVSISHDGTNWSPWVTWESGAYNGECLTA